MSEEKETGVEDFKALVLAIQKRQEESGLTRKGYALKIGMSYTVLYKWFGMFKDDEVTYSHSYKRKDKTKKKPHYTQIWVVRSLSSYYVEREDFELVRLIVAYVVGAKCLNRFVQNILHTEAT